MRSVKHFALSLLFLYIIFDKAAQGKASSEKKIYDYWTMFVNDGRIKETDVFTIFGRLVELGQIDQLRDEINREDHRRPMTLATIGHQFLEVVRLSNVSNLECRNEVNDLLSAMAVFTYSLSVRCEAIDMSEAEMSECRQGTQRRIEEHIWAAKLLNSWGTPSSGLLTQGQFLWHGSYHQCVETRVSRGSSGRRAARYCLITIGPSFEQWALPQDESSSSLSLRAQIGACLPPSCVEYDGSEILTMILESFANSSEAISTKLRETVSEHHIYCEPKQQLPLDVSQILVVLLICILSSLVVAGTIIEYCVEVRAAKRRSEMRVQKMLRDNNHGSTVESAQTTDCMESIKQRVDYESVISFKSQESLRRSIRRLKWWLHMITAFSVRMNVGWLTNNRTSSVNGERSGTRITCLYGIRVVTMIWVIVGHTYVFAMPHLSNLVEATERMPVQFFSQLILNSSLSVDTFFLISGLLNCYMWCLRQKKNYQKKPTRISIWLAYYGHRYARLVPAYVLVIAVVVSSLYSKFGSGPRWDSARISGVQCDRNTWWRHLFFVNNLIPGGEHCLPWMWHLAVDIQCYLVAPLFIIPLWKRPKLGCALIIVTVLASALARGLVVGLMRLPTNLMLFLPTDNFRNDFHVYFDLIYQKPYFRCGPYLIGLLTGWMLATKTDQLRMWHRFNWKRKTLVWAMIFAFCFWPLFGLFPFLSGTFYSPVYNGLFAAVNRTLWSMGVAMMIISCHCQFGCSYLNAVFSWIGWWPFARLSYGVYLVHELLMVYVYFSLRGPITYDGHVSLLAYFAFFTAISYALALVLFIIAEGPALAAERLLFRRKPGSASKRNQKSKEEPAVVRERRSLDLARQRMTERWSTFAAAAESRSSQSPSGVHLYKGEDTLRLDVVEEAVQVESRKGEGVESSVQASISQNKSVDESLKSVSLRASSCRTEKDKEDV